MAEGWYGDNIEDLVISSCPNVEVPDISEEDKVLEEGSRKDGRWGTSVLQVTNVDLELSSEEVGAVWYCGDGGTPTHELQKPIEIYAIEDMSPAAGDPRFTDQGAVSKRGFVSMEMIKDFVNDLHGDSNRVPDILARDGCFRACANC